MNNFKSRGGPSRGGSFGGARSGGRPPYKKSFGGSDDSRPTIKHRTVCSKCGNQCEVPFIPSGDRPVLCRDCFVPKAEVAERGRPVFNKFGPKRSFEDRAPRADFGRSELRSSPAAGDTNAKQFAELNAKIDKLTALVERLLNDNVQ